MSFSRHAWWLYLALMAPITVAYLAGPLNAGPVFNAIGFSACVAIVLGVRMHRPAARWSWYLIALLEAIRTPLAVDDREISVAASGSRSRA